ncbi:PD-(D/E)XK endonuclease-like domain-containing protein [Desulfonema limicola]|uniref:PD-(D/E)XK endonuclease-like domain-containing protein n=1 Tax=Desulfonema limicola TaxID=45656 RepID=A0A975GIJ9_9BACT|nr:AAA-like domain-containing protein [Desulfonema limicola]QTA82680.1 PD-(D/E)XK endonuclease-like domain-containing protein [Desulfonema limicola]
MEKEFNDTGVCVPSRHYMVNTSDKIKSIIQLIEKGKYFTISRPRQFGKTTTLQLLSSQLNLIDKYLTLNISFEGTGDSFFANEQVFCPGLLRIIARTLRFSNPEIYEYLLPASRQVHNFEELSQFISQYVLEMNKHVVLFIDEVDKSSDNQIFLHFLGMLRNKYLLRDTGRDYTFHSVILAGVHDIKTLKAKIRPDDDRKYNSPWNIAADFNVDLSFAPHEIETMLEDYSRKKNIVPDIAAIAEKLYYYTSGYPWLVSKLCKFIDEDIAAKREEKNWTTDDIETAFKMITDESYTSTLFDSLAKNLENNRKLYDLVSRISINGASFPFTISDPVISLGSLYGILVPAEQGRCRIHNRIFEQRIYAHIMSRLLQTRYAELDNFGIPEFYTDKGLDIKMIMLRFQAFMKEHYSKKDARFLECEGRLLFLSYLRPIINGKGFDFKEPNVSDERRMDIVITYRDQRFVIELKIWHGQKYHEKGLKQLSNYLDMYSLKQGYLLIYDFNQNKEYRQEQIVFEDKEIFAVWV